MYHPIEHIIHSSEVKKSPSETFWNRNVGKMDPKSKRVGTGLVGAPACGDVMKLQIEVPLTEVTFSIELIDFF